MADRIQVRRDTSTNWNSANPTLAAGELGFATNFNLLKVGTGVDAWTALPYVNPQPNQIVGGRLSVYQNIAEPSPDMFVVNNPLATILYYVPYTGDRISLYFNGTWRPFIFDYSTSIPLTGLPADTNYDVFANPVGVNGPVRLSLTPWTDSWTRATALVSFEGALVKNGDATFRYLGTIRTTVAGRTEVTRYRKYVFNYYNRVPCFAQMFHGVGHSYTSGYWRPYDLFNNWDSAPYITAGADYGRLSFVSGVPLPYKLSFTAGVRNGWLTPMAFLNNTMRPNPTDLQNNWNNATNIVGLPIGYGCPGAVPNCFVTSSESMAVTFNSNGLAQFWLAQTGIGADSYFAFANLNVELAM
jgi:hypothetical protein